ncbi:type I restriction endonuclease, partial [Stenotrophomonas sp. HMWF003]|uniref:type I restriction endonuclease n=1 Tax=Stenotrophomonas sp. HMWF003 TaxID=2056840 RepID=UPI000D4102BB
MSRAPVRGVVTRSTLGWLQRLGWQYLAPNRRCSLRGDDGSALLEGRLRQYLHQLRFEAYGEHWPLDAEGIAQVLAAVTQGPLRRGSQAGADALLVALRNGVCVAQRLPDGRTVRATVPLVDWAEPLNNQWDIASARGEGQMLLDAAPRIDVLVGYVNGLPLLRLLCVERDGQGRWGRDDAAIALHGQQMRASGSACRPPLLLALDRRGGRYSCSGTPANGWVRWREHDWSADAVQQLRGTVPMPRTGAAATNGRWLRAVHAPLLAGVAAPARVLALLRGFMHTGADGQPRIARAAQFFAVQTGLAQLRRVDAEGCRGRGHLRLAAGAGMALTWHWLVQHVQRDPWLRHCRVLLVQQRPAVTPLPATRGEPALSPGRRLAAFMADGRGCTLQTTPGTLQAWLRRRDAGHDGDDLIVLVDAHLQAGQPAWVERARERLPRAGWLWLGSGPLAEGVSSAACDPLLFACSTADAIADGLVVPVYHHALQPT